MGAGYHCAVQCLYRLTPIGRPKVANAVQLHCLHLLFPADRNHRLLPDCADQLAVGRTMARLVFGVLLRLVGPAFRATTCGIDRSQLCRRSPDGQGRGFRPAQDEKRSISLRPQGFRRRTLFCRSASPSSPSRRSASCWTSTRASPKTTVLTTIYCSSRTSHI
jgi:hypothetical protein